VQVAAEQSPVRSLSKGLLVTPVPWVTTPPDLIEQIVAVLLSRRHPQAVRVRASQGDGGLDVLVPTATLGYVDNYQVKRFATGLGDSQKGQIRESLKTARDTHNDPTNPVLIETWCLTLPMDPSPPEITWLTRAAARLKLPFKVEWRPLPFLEGLVTEYPEVIDYYLRDGRDRLEGLIADLRDLARLPVSATGAAVQPGDLTERLGALFLSLNRQDPHYRYEFEVTAEPPILFERPYLVASVIDSGPGWCVTFHIYARYLSAPEDRPIPISFAVSGTDLTPEMAEAVNAMLRYGTPVDLPAAAIRDLTFDMPGGLGLDGGTGNVSLGPAHGHGDTPARVVWAIVPPDSLQPIAQLSFEMEAPTRGALDGIIVHGTDTTGVVAASITVDPPGDEHPAIRLSVTLINPHGKPVRQALSGLRFLRLFHAANRLAFGPEYGPLTAADSLPLPGSPQAIPAPVLHYAEALDIISQRSNTAIPLPELSALTSDDYAAVIGAAAILRGEAAYGTWVPIPAHPKPDEIDPRLMATAGPVSTEQPLTVSVAGIEYDLGKAYSYLPSARIEGDITADPGPDGTIDVTLVPGDDNHAVRSLRKLSRADVQAVIDLHNSTSAPQPGTETGPVEG
jgi:hypothetical protein